MKFRKEGMLPILSEYFVFRYSIKAESSREKGWKHCKSSVFLHFKELTYRLMRIADR